MKSNCPDFLLPVEHFQQVLAELHDEFRRASGDERPAGPAPDRTLQTALLHWDSTGDLRPLVDYLGAFKPETVKPPEVALTAWQVSCARDKPIYAFHHEALEEISAHADEENIKQHREMLRQELGLNHLPHILKSVTGSVHLAEGKVFFMLSCIGDELLSPQLKKEIYGTSRLPRGRVKKHMKLIDPDCDVTACLGMDPGHVGPLAHRYDGIKYLFYVVLPPCVQASSPLVALRFTPTDTLILTREIFEPLLVAYMIWQNVEIHFLVCEP